MSVDGGYFYPSIHPSICFKWLLDPMEKRETVLEEIIAGGFSADMLDDEEKEELFNFSNREYINAK